MTGWQDAPLAEPDTAVAPAWASAPVVGSPASTVTQRAAHGPLEALQAGYQGSATGLMFRNRLPDVVLDPQHATWYEKALASVGQMASELPEMIAGGVGGGVAGSAVGPLGTLVGTGAGAFALPTAIRESYVQALSKGEVTSSGDFLSRAAIVLKETGKSALVGGATFGAGALAARGVGAAIAPAIGESLSIPAASRIIGGAETAGQYGAMVVTPAALEGKLPEPEDFYNAAILVGGLKIAGAVAGKLRSVYAEAGVPPEQVLADAKSDSTIREDLLRPMMPGVEDGFTRIFRGESVAKQEVPDWVRQGLERTGAADAQGRWWTSDRDIAEWYAKDAGPSGRVVYQDVPHAVVDASRVANAPEAIKRFSLDPNNELFIPQEFVGKGQEIPRAYRPLAMEQTVRDIVPEDRAQQFIDQPFAEVTQPKGAPVIPGQINYHYLNDPELIGPTLARMAEIAAPEIEKARGKIGWDQTDAEASKVIQDVTQGRVPLDSVLGLVPGDYSVTTKMAVASKFVNGLGALVKTQAADYDAKMKAGTLTLADKAEALANTQRAAMIFSQVLGQRADAARALNSLKNTRMAAANAEEMLRVIKDSPNDIDQIMKSLKDTETPGDALRAAQKSVDPTFANKIGEIYKAILLSGPKTYQVKALGDSVNIAMTTAERWVAATISKIPGVGSGQVTYSEALGYTAGMREGVRDALRDGAAAWNGEGPFEHTRAIGGRAGEVLSIPHRIMSSETKFFRTLDESGQLNALAIRQAISEKLTPGTSDFSSRVADIRANPSDEIAAAVKLAGDRGTFTEKLGELGQAVQAFSRTSVGQFIVPFARVPANLLKFAVRYLPGLNLAIPDVRADLAKGGAGRDLALAKMVIGSTIATAAYGAVANGTLTGSGATFTPEEKSGKIASGEWQPYSIKMGGKWYSYNRFEPMARVAGIGADIAELTDRVEGDDKASLPALVALMFGHAVISETYLSTLDGLMKGLEDPKRNGKLVFDNFVGSWVPGFLAQTATAMDPNKRVVDDWLDSLQSRIPLLREQLLPKINPLTGVAEPNPKNITPVDVVSEASDKVLSEAGRIGVMARGAPQNIQLPGSSIDKRAGQVATTPEQRQKFDIAAGTLAHQILTPIVSAEGWDTTPDVIQRRIYQKVLAASHKLGAAAAFTPEERAAYVAQQQEKISAELAATGEQQ